MWLYLVWPLAVLGEVVLGDAAECGKAVFGMAVLILVALVWVTQCSYCT